MLMLEYIVKEKAGKIIKERFIFSLYRIIGNEYVHLLVLTTRWRLVCLYNSLMFFSGEIIL